MKPKKNYKNIGAAGFFILFSLLFFILIVRFITIQYTGEAEGKVLSAEAAELYSRESVLKAKRGTIYDHAGEVIAEDTSAYTLIAILDDTLTTDPKHPRHVVDPQETAEKLANLIDMKEEEIYALLTKKNRKQVEFGTAGRDLSYSVKKKIQQLKLPGIEFIKDSKRFYPNGIFASHLIGYAQKEKVKDGNLEIVGKTGLEKSYDRLLKGTDGSIQYESDVWNYILPNSDKHVKEPENGSDLYLTLDKKIQTFLEDAMTKVDKQYSPERIMAIVADPKTGKILGMGQRPTFHPETREGIDQTWHNEIIESTFEPGSTMKIFSLAAAIDKGVFNPNETFPSGQYRVDTKSQPIRDHNGGRGWGSITYLEGVQRSSNVGFAYLLEKMGTETWREYMDRFNFGDKTGIALPNEAPGKILYDWPIEKVTSVFGQGTTVTAIQMIQGITAIANDGVMMKPYVVDKIVQSNKEATNETKPEVAGKPISKKTAKEVRDILKTVITAEHGTGSNFEIKGYEVAGKTGTAQISNPAGGYLMGRNNYIFSFLGMAPADNPKLVMYVLVEKPQLKENENGSIPVSKIFNTVMKSSLQYLNIEPEKVPEKATIKVPDFTTMDKKAAIRLAEKHKLEPIVVGKGDTIIGQSNPANSTIMEEEKIILKTDGDLTIPNMVGWSKREVISVAQLADINVKLEGTGFVYKQSIKPNSVMKKGEEIVLKFETPLEQHQREQKKKDKQKQSSQ